MLDYRRALVAFTKDPEWKRKLGVGVLVSLIPYVGMVWLTGWEMEYQRNVAWGQDESLPDWSGFSRQALLGLKGFVAVLPYSLILSVFLTPAIMIVPATGAFVADSGNAFGMLTIYLAVTFLSTTALTLLLIPFISSTMLRVSLYGTYEAGFQFKEVWRLMREFRAELLRAWGYAVLNMAISLGFMVVYFGTLAVMMMGLPGGWEQKILGVFALGFVGYIAYIPLALALSFVLRLANMHLFGRYGRIAYRLDEAAQERERGISGTATTERIESGSVHE